MDTTSLRVEWGSRVRRRRGARALSCRRLAALADIDPGNLSGIETGRRSTSDEMKLRIAAALDTTVGELFPWPSTIAETAALVGNDLTEEAA